MKRGQGIFAAVLVLAGGAMLRSPMQPGAGETKVFSQAGAVQMPTGATPVSGEGPWKASCNYWKPGIPITTTPVNSSGVRTNRTSTLSLSISQSGSAFQSTVSGTVQPDAACGTDGWGIPDRDDAKITAIIATVPDPLRSSTPWEFDRAIEVLTEAAAQYGYVGSYFWLPWQRAAGDNTPLTQTKADASEDADRKKLPGLLLLKQSQAIPRSSSARGGMGTTVRGATAESSRVPRGDGNDHVLYLFLVGQSPALGVNGDQMQNALNYERLLRTTHYASLSFKQTGTTQIRQASSGTAASSAPTIVAPGYLLDVIGPENSGGAASLRAALETVTDAGMITVAGAASTSMAADTVERAVRGGGAVPIAYVSFANEIGDTQSRLCERFQPVDGGVPQLAFMIESGTVFGMSEQTDTEKQRSTDIEKQRSTQTGKQPSDDPCKGRLVIWFPRNISLLRNAETEDLGGMQPSPSAPAAPYLRLSLKDTSQDDTIPSFSGPVTPYSQEAQWMAIVRELTRANVKTVVVSASNTLDELFLVKSLHRDVPDARVVVYDGGDLLFARVGDDQAYLGTITLGVYSLVKLNGTLGYQGNLLSFADSFTESLFNAASYTFWSGNDISNLHLAEYGTGEDQEFGVDEVVPPPLWATAVGRDGYYPLGVMSRCGSEDPRVLPRVLVYNDRILRKKCVLNDYELRADTGARTTPAFSWYVICVLLATLALAQTLVLSTASFWSPVTKDLDFAENDQPRRRAMYVHIATAALWCMSFISILPVYAARSLIRPGSYTHFVCMLTLASALTAVVVTVGKTRKYWGARGAPSDPALVASSPDAFTDIEKNMDNESSFYPLFNVIAVLTAIAIPAIWCYMCSDLCGLIEDPALAGTFFAFRCLYPVSGVSPLVPMLLVLLTWYIWAALQTRRLQFSENTRPLLPPRSAIASIRLSYVSDESLSDCSHQIDHCLFENIECLLITRQLIRRRLPATSQKR